MSSFPVQGVIVIEGKKEFIDKLYVNLEEIIEETKGERDPDSNPSDFKQKLTEALVKLSTEDEVQADYMERLSDNALRFASTAWGLQDFINELNDIDKRAKIYFKLCYDGANVYNFYDPTGKYFHSFEIGDLKTNFFDEVKEYLESNEYQNMDELREVEGVSTVAGFPVHKDIDVYEGEGSLDYKDVDLFDEDDDMLYDIINAEIYNDDEEEDDYYEDSEDDAVEVENCTEEEATEDEEPAESESEKEEAPEIPANGIATKLSDGTLWICGNASLQDYIKQNEKEWKALLGEKDSVEHIIFKGNVTNIFGSLFSNRFRFNEFPSLTQLELPEGLEEIPINAFKDCRNLQKLVLPDSLRKIEYTAFKGCDALAEVVNLHDGVKYGRAFKHAPLLKDVIPAQ